MPWAAAEGAGQGTPSRSRWSGVVKEVGARRVGIGRLRCNAQRLCRCTTVVPQQNSGCRWGGGCGTYRRMGEVVVPREAARRLGVSEGTVRRLVAAGRVAGHRLPYAPGTGRPFMLGVDVDEIRPTLRPV